MRSFRWVFFLLPALLTGCSFMPTRPAAELSNDELCRAVREARFEHKKAGEFIAVLTNRGPYRPEHWLATFQGHIEAGMNSAEVRCSWGDPNRINLTTVDTASTEQWVFGGFNGPESYVYLRDGIVYASQTTGSP